MFVLLPSFLLQTDFEKDVDIACRSGKSSGGVFGQGKDVLCCSCDGKSRRSSGLNCSQLLKEIIKEVYFVFSWKALIRLQQLGSSHRCVWL